MNMKAIGQAIKLNMSEKDLVLYDGDGLLVKVQRWTDDDMVLSPIELVEASVQVSETVLLTPAMIDEKVTLYVSRDGWELLMSSHQDVESYESKIYYMNHINYVIETLPAWVAVFFLRIVNKLISSE